MTRETLCLGLRARLELFLPAYQCIEPQDRLYLARAVDLKALAEQLTDWLESEGVIAQEETP